MLWTLEFETSRYWAFMSFSIFFELFHYKRTYYKEDLFGTTKTLNCLKDKVFVFLLTIKIALLISNINFNLIIAKQKNALLKLFFTMKFAELY